jgi:hypothetical protein
MPFMIEMNRENNNRQSSRRAEKESPRFNPRASISICSAQWRLPVDFCDPGNHAVQVPILKRPPGQPGSFNKHGTGVNRATPGQRARTSMGAAKTNAAPAPHPTRWVPRNSCDRSVKRSGTATTNQKENMKQELNAPLRKSTARGSKRAVKQRSAPAPLPTPKSATGMSAAVDQGQQNRET